MISEFGVRDLWKKNPDIFLKQVLLESLHGFLLSTFALEPLWYKLQGTGTAHTAWMLVIYA